MNIMWWNLQRLGATTQQVRTRPIELVHGTIPAHLYVFCELTPECVAPSPQQYVYRRRNGRQLCYGVIGRNLQNPPCVRYTPAPTACYSNAGFKGGNDFTNLADRAPGHTVLTDGTPLYYLHAPASTNTAIRAMTFMACDLIARHGAAPWLMVGDFNVEPDRLRARAPQPIGRLIKKTGLPTHLGRHPRELDYVLSNIRDVEITHWSGLGVSDHKPILVTYDLRHGTN
ncbi:hypothetical protein [Plantactinospora sp. GCM10030261]|uniref:hypothetical protein n=1 Tax=Plantactinospora sp. GCM10030261 TaxID=3273420 RepID=UPI003609F4A2